MRAQSFKRMAELVDAQGAIVLNYVDSPTLPIPSVHPTPEQFRDEIEEYNQRGIGKPLKIMFLQKVKDPFDLKRKDETTTQLVEAILQPAESTL
jgi:hypothetical protein